jgi:TonB family protein
MLLVCFLAGLRLRRVVRQSQTMSIGDQEVLLSDSLGPAVLGLIRPRIVLPRWLAEQESALRTYVLSHEREHIAARDQLTLFAALLIVALMPWNIALWWQLRRLRKAIEVDCDSRVLREGVNAHEYSEALLTIGRRSTRAPFASVALTEAVSDLEKRIRIMMDKARDFSLVGFGMRSLLFVSVLGLALAVNAPLAHQAADAKNIDTSLRIEVTEKFSAVEACFEQNDFDCTLSILTELAESSDLTVYEAAQVQQGIATVGHSIDDPAVSMAAYEQILALPGEKVPDGLIHRAAQNLARLYLQNDRVNEGREMYDRYLALPTMTPRSRDYYLLAAILYQVDRHQDAIAPLRQAIATSKEPNKQYYTLLYVLQYQTDNQSGMLDTLEKLNAYWPGELPDVLASLGTSEFAGTLPGVGGTPRGSYLPIVANRPNYPEEALARGLEGSVLVRYTVSTTGHTKDVEVLESSSQLFEDAAIESAENYKYEPRIIDGTPVEVAGVTTRIEFELEDSED